MGGGFISLFCSLCVCILALVMFFMMK
jgi:hypothetical protein